MNYSEKMTRVQLLRNFQKRIAGKNCSEAVQEEMRPAPDKLKSSGLLLKALTCIGITGVTLIVLLNLNYLHFLSRPYGYPADVYPKLEILFNKNYSRINNVLKYSRMHGFPPLLTTAIIYAESSNNAFTLSHVKARGLMQVREETGYDTALMYGKKPMLAKIIQRYPDILYYPRLNIYLSTLYIKTFKELYGWNWENSLHAYNVGPNAFLRGQRHFYYVNRIMRFYNHWTKLSPKEIRKVYFNDLYSIFGKKLKT